MCKAKRKFTSAFKCFGLVIFFPPFFGLVSLPVLLSETLKAKLGMANGRERNALSELMQRCSQRKKTGFEKFLN